MVKQYSCKLCGKLFNQKIDFTRHQNRKAPCISLAEMEKIILTKEVKTDIKSTLINVFKSCLNILRDNEGLTGEKALRNMSYLLILKLIEPHLDGEIDIDNYEYDFSHIEDDNIERHRARLLELARFSILATEKEANIPTNIKYLWDDILAKHPATRNIFLRDKGFDIREQSTYKKLIDKLNSLDLTQNEYDVLGEAYEEVIQDIMTGKVLGQFFTQPLVKKMMVELINPQIHSDGTIETCGDPTMGTGGFLITYLKYILQQAEDRGIQPDWQFIKTVGLYGKELEPDTYQLAVSNMLISSGHMFEQLDRGDSIREPITRKFDNILANPPFGIKGLIYDDFRSPLKGQYIPIKSDNAVSLFIQAIIHMLNIDGKCAVVIPDGQDLFSKTNKRLVAVREYLMKTCDLIEIIYLPAGIFTYTSIKTCIFYFVKRIEGSDALTVNVTYSKTTQKETRRVHKFVKGHQTKSVKFYECDPERAIKTLLIEVPIQDIENNKYSLNHSEYMKEESIEEYSDGVIVRELGEVCNFDIGGTPSRSKIEYYENGANLWVSVKELNGGCVCDTKEKINDLGVKNSSVKLFAEGTILFSFKLSIGKTAIAGRPLYTNEAIAGILSKDEDLLNNKYLYYYLTISDFTKLGSGVIGGGSLNKKSLSSIKIPIPSLERQQKVVEYLDFIHEVANKSSTEKIAELRKLNECCLNNQRIFGDRVIVKELGEVCKFKNGYSFKSTEYVEYKKTNEKSIGILQIKSIQKGFVDEKKITAYIEENRKYASFEIHEGDILIGLTGTFKIGLYNLKQKSYLNQRVGKIIAKDVILQKYIYYWYLCCNIEYEVSKMAKGTAQANISTNEISKIKIPVPPLDLQKEFVEYCEFNDSLIQTLEKEIENNKKQAEQFIKSIMAPSSQSTGEDLEKTPNIRKRVVVYESDEE